MSTPPDLAASQVEVQLPLTGGTWLAVPVVDDVDGEGVEGAVSGQGVGAGPGEGVDLVVEGAVVLLAPRHAHGATTHGWVGCMTPVDKPTVSVQVCFPRIPVSLCVLFNCATYAVSLSHLTAIRNVFPMISSSQCSYYLHSVLVFSSPYYQNKTIYNTGVLTLINRKFLIYSIEIPTIYSGFSRAFLFKIISVLTMHLHIDFLSVTYSK